MRLRGNASADIARTYLLFCLQDQKKADMYMDIFCKKTGAAKYVSDMAADRSCGSAVKKRPEEVELLQKWANVCDYQ